MPGCCARTRRSGLRPRSGCGPGRSASMPRQYPNCRARAQLARGSECQSASLPACLHQIVRTSARSIRANYCSVFQRQSQRPPGSSRTLNRGFPRMPLFCALRSNRQKPPNNRLGQLVSRHVPSAQEGMQKHAQKPLLTFFNFTPSARAHVAIHDGPTTSRHT
jgi:hypothetical protein